MNHAKLVGSEIGRERACLAQWCPNCGAPPGARCRYTTAEGYASRSMTSHTGRYLVALDRGRVPGFAGGWRGR